ncbi:MAG: GNAT family N-acetyltransferase [Photobacterium frigidiphilum]|uniref:GNAT family N-acetyltransferase n=1 Tax=Photobacterium frigidiphilum TaxID=264736 RepID=UPI0030013B46
MKIETKRLELVPISENDWSFFLRLHTEKKIISLCFDEPSIEVIKAKFESRLVTWDPSSDAWLCLVISDKLSGDTIGVTGFVIQDGFAEVGYLLLPEFHGKQYGTESLSALLEWAVTTHKITNYKAVVTEGNLGSERVLVKCGFQLESIVPEAYEISGKLYADHVYHRDNKVMYDSRI